MPAPPSNYVYVKSKRPKMQPNETYSAASIYPLG